MPLPVSVRDVVDEMDSLSETDTAYINRRTGELFTVTEEEVRLVDDGIASEEQLPEWQRESLPKLREVLESEDFIPLPDKFEIHEWAIMERFAAALSEPRQSMRLIEALRGRGAFRRFKALVREWNVEEEWYRFRTDALEEIAIEFLRAHEIPFTKA